MSNLEEGASSIQQQQEEKLLPVSRRSESKLINSHDDDVSKQDLNLAFDQELYDQIVKLESVAIPFSNDSYFSHRTSLLLVVLIFTLPFLWSLVSPFLKLNPPDHVFFDACYLKNFSYALTTNYNDWFINSDGNAQLNFTECVKCNGGLSNKLSTQGVNILKTLQWSYLGFFFGFAQTFFWLVFYYKLLVDRTRRTEILLCYGVFLQPTPFKLLSAGGGIVTTVVIVTLIGAGYVAFLSTWIEKGLRSQIQFGQNFNTPVCIAGTFTNHSIAPMFDDGNASIGGSDSFSVFTMLSVFLPFIPVILTIYNLVVSPVKNITSLEVLNNFDLYRSTVKVEVPEAFFDKAILKKLLEDAKNEKSEGAVGVAKDAAKLALQLVGGGIIAGLKALNKRNQFGVTWGDSVEEISAVCTRALKLQEEEEQKNGVADKKKKKKSTLSTHTSNLDSQQLQQGGKEMNYAATSDV